MGVRVTPRCRMTDRAEPPWDWLERSGVLVVILLALAVALVLVVGLLEIVQ